MADFKKIKYPTGTSPRGVARFAHLNEADTYEGKVAFKVDLMVPASEAQDLITRIENLLAALASGDAKVHALLSEDEIKRMTTALKTKKLKPHDPAAFGPKTDKEGNVDESTIVFKFKKNGEYKDKKGAAVATTLPLFSASGAKSDAKVGGGSEIKVAYELRPWVNAKSEYGVKLAMSAVQVLVAQSGGGGGAAADYGFGNEGPDEEGETTAAPKPAVDDSDPDF